MRFVLAIVLGLLSCSAFAEGESSESGWKFGLGVGFSPNHLVDMKGTATASGNTDDVNYFLNYKAAAEASIHVWYAPRNSWGFISGFFYGAERDFDRGSINGWTIGPTSATSKYQTHFAYLGTLYRWESFYLPLGLAYGIPTFTPADTSQVETAGGVGALLGLGWFIGEHVAIEYIMGARPFPLSSRLQVQARLIPRGPFPPRR